MFETKEKSIFLNLDELSKEPKLEPKLEPKPNSYSNLKELKTYLKRLTKDVDSVESKLNRNIGILCDKRNDIKGIIDCIDTIITPFIKKMQISKLDWLFTKSSKEEKPIFLNNKCRGVIKTHLTNLVNDLFIEVKILEKDFIKIASEFNKK